MLWFLHSACASGTGLIRDRPVWGVYSRVAHNTSSPFIPFVPSALPKGHTDRAPS